MNKDLKFLYEKKTGEIIQVIKVNETKTMNYYVHPRYSFYIRLSKRTNDSMDYVVRDNKAELIRYVKQYEIAKKKTCIQGHQVRINALNEAIMSHYEEIERLDREIKIIESWKEE